jgi:hypothetical protein
VWVGSEVCQIITDDDSSHIVYPASVDLDVESCLIAIADREV